MRASSGAQHNLKASRTRVPARELPAAPCAFTDLRILPLPPPRRTDLGAGMQGRELVVRGAGDGQGVGGGRRRGF